MGQDRLFKSNNLGGAAHREEKTAHGRDLGHFVIVLPTASAAMSATSDERHTAVALADQLGMALLRYDRPT